MAKLNKRRGKSGRLVGVGKEHGGSEGVGHLELEYAVFTPSVVGLHLA